MRRLIAFAFVLISACGARTGLEVGERDAGQDAHIREPDASVPDEQCNGADDDRDGSIDEDLPPIECTSGTCRQEIPGCVGGHVPECPPIEPSDEVCNETDDDCDGRIDEGLGFGPIGDPIVVREANDGTTGDASCAECREVIRGQLVTIGGELYAIWHLNFFGVISVPNTFIRPLDQDAMPIGPSRPLFDASTTRLSVAPSHSGRSIATFCQRLEDRRDYPRSIFLDGRANVIGDILPRAPADAICLYVPLAVWTGDRHLFALSRRGGPATLDFEIADPDARTIRTTDVDYVSATEPLAFDGALATFASWERLSDPLPGGPRSRLRIAQLDVDGSIVYQRALPWPTSGVEWDRQVVVSSDAGPLLVATGAIDPTSLMPEGRLGLMRFDRSRDAVDGVAEIPIELEASELAVTRRSGDELIVAVEGRPLNDPRSDGDQLEILEIRDSGEELDRWTFPDGVGDRSRFTIHTDRGRVFLTYVHTFWRGNQTVEVLPLGCTP